MDEYIQIRLYLVLVIKEFLFYNKFIIRLYMFRALCAHHQEVKIVLYSIWYRHICRWPSGAHRTATYRCDGNRCSIIQF